MTPRLRTPCFVRPKTSVVPSVGSSSRRCEDGELVLVPDLVDDVVDVRAFVVVGARRLDDDGVVEVLRRDLVHPLRRRRREERRLPLAGRLREDALDVRREAAVEHLVRLVEHEVGDAVEAHRAARQVVEHAARACRRRPARRGRSRPAAGRRRGRRRSASS